MANTVNFYHFNTEEAMNQSNLKSTDIAFCAETKVIKTHGVEYGRQLQWAELGSSESTQTEQNEEN